MNGTAHVFSGGTNDANSRDGSDSCRELVRLDGGVGLQVRSRQMVHAASMEVSLAQRSHNNKDSDPIGVPRKITVLFCSSSSSSTREGFPDKLEKGTPPSPQRGRLKQTKFIPLKDLISSLSPIDVVHEDRSKWNDSSSSSGIQEFPKSSGGGTSVDSLSEHDEHRTAQGYLDDTCPWQTNGEGQGLQSKRGTLVAPVGYSDWTTSTRVNEPQARLAICPEPPQTYGESCGRIGLHHEAGTASFTSTGDTGSTTEETVRNVASRDKDYYWKSLEAKEVGTQESRRQLSPVRKDGYIYVCHVRRFPSSRNLEQEF
jgi:hypothetical protein